MSDAGALAMLLRETKPDEVYNLAAQSHVAVSFVMPKCVPRRGAPAQVVFRSREGLRG